jgi:hypothetical protein
LKVSRQGCGIPPRPAEGHWQGLLSLANLIDGTLTYVNRCSRLGVIPMAQDGRTPEVDELVRRLVATTGITETQAFELIALLGLNWASLMREAKVLQATQRP